MTPGTASFKMNKQLTDDEMQSMPERLSSTNFRIELSDGGSFVDFAPCIGVKLNRDKFLLTYFLTMSESLNEKPSKATVVNIVLATRDGNQAFRMQHKIKNPVVCGYNLKTGQNEPVEITMCYDIVD